jgi:hypothetical protein
MKNWGATNPEFDAGSVNAHADSISVTPHGSSILEPIVQRLEEQSRAPGNESRTRVSVMEFSAPPAPFQPETERGGPDRSVLIGVAAGLFGAAVIIVLTLYLF